MRYCKGMECILISACLLGRPVRYDGRAKPSGAGDILARWQAEGRLVPICPEVWAGLPTPRPPAEMSGGGGADVLAGQAIVAEQTGRDVTGLFVQGAHEAVAVARRHGCRYAVLTDGSPSCGSSFVYDGSFSGARMEGAGVTTAALRAAGVEVWPHSAIAELYKALRASPRPE